MRSAIAFALVVFSSLQVLAGIDLKGLADQPHLVPETTTVHKDLTFPRNMVIKSGSQVKVLGVNGQNLSVGVQGRPGTYAIPAAATSILVDADAYIAKLPPEQQKLTLADMVAHKDRWPYRVTINGQFQFNDRTFNVAEKAILGDFNGKDVTVYDPQRHSSYTLPANGTSIFKDCMAAATTAPKMSRLYNELKENSLDVESGKPTTLFDDGGPEYVALYCAAGWCPYSTECSPDVIKWYNDAQQAGKKRIALMLVSADKTPQELTEHLKKLGMKIAYVKFNGQQRMPLLQGTQILTGLPYLLVTDRTGKVVAGESNAMPKDRTQAALAEMTKLQDAPAKP